MNGSYDLIVIGAGAAGREAAGKAAADYGARVALIESTFWGGSCPNVACQPTKAYLVAAELVRDLAELGPSFGVEATQPDLAKIWAWKESVKRTQAAWEDSFAAAGIDAIKGQATLLDARTVRVNGETLEAERMLIGTGSRTAVPPIPGLEEIAWLDHVSALELTELPASLLVLGAGAVGLEFAQIFARLGSKVTLVEALPQIAAHADSDAAASLQEALVAEGIEVLVGSPVERFAYDHGAALAHVGDRILRVSDVLLATGRVPNVERYGLDTVGVELSRHGIIVDARMRTNVPGIWAAGDVVEGPQFTPVAGYQAAIAVDDMFGSTGSTADYSLLPTAIFTDPELAGFGLTETEARDRGYEVETVIHPVSSVTRAYFTNSLHGMFKVVFDSSSREVLGIHIVSRSASDIVGGLALTFRPGLTVDELAAGHYVYPSFSEGVKAAAQLAKPRLLQSA
jgi:mercuric reductase